MKKKLFSSNSKIHQNRTFHSFKGPKIATFESQRNMNNGIFTTILILKKALGAQPFGHCKYFSKLMPLASGQNQELTKNKMKI